MSQALRGKVVLVDTDLSRIQMIELHGAPEVRALLSSRWQL